MFKLVVLFSAVCALAAAKPGAVLAAPLAAPFATPFASPLAYSSSFYSPTVTNTVLQPAPLYQSPTFISGAHFIKKRSAIAPLAYSPAVIAPTAFSSQSRIDYPTKTIYAAAASPILTHFSSPYTYAHF